MFPPSTWSLAGRGIEPAPPRRRIDAPLPTVRHPSTVDEELVMTIRRARPDDAQRLADLAALDSRRPLRGDILVAEVGGAAIAAYDVFTGRSVADPLTPSAGAVDLLRVRADQLRAADRPAPRRRHHPFAAVAGLLR